MNKEESLALFGKGRDRLERLGRENAWRARGAGGRGVLGRGPDRARVERDDKLHNPRVVLAALLVTENRLDEATSALAEARRIRPQLSRREVRGIVGGRFAKVLGEIWDL